MQNESVLFWVDFCTRGLSLSFALSSRNIGYICMICFVVFIRICFLNMNLRTGDFL